MFKRIFGKADEEVSTLNVGRLAPPAPGEGTCAPPDPSSLDLPSRKPAPNIQDFVLPETLAEEATHPREVDLRFVLGSGSNAPAGSNGLSELTDPQIETIAERVADKLAAGVLGDRLRETVRQAVSEASERLIRDEIARIRNAAEDE